jgi:CRISPR-associated endonuclease/helicase Cas3
VNYWGRIFFTYEGERLASVWGQPLDSHVNNCRLLLDRFQETFFHPQTRERLLRAVQLHDQGKRDTFRIRRGDDERLAYSFAGHRFRVPHDDPYVAGLIRAHHEYSVAQINSERALLESDEDRKRFADDLYLLCMADQIEAELAVKAVEGKTDVPRTFMEFTTRRLVADPGVFRVIPWPFKEDGVPLSFELKELSLEDIRDRNSPKEIEKALKSAGHFRERSVAIRLVRGDNP